MKLLVTVTMTLVLTAYAVNAQESWSTKDKARTAVILNEQGVAELRLGHHVEAIRIFSRAVETEPDFAVAYNNLGVTYNALGRYDEAVVLLMRAVRIKPDYAESYYDMGVSYLKLRQYQNSVKAYQQAIRLKPGYAETFLNLGFLEQATGRLPLPSRA